MALPLSHPDLIAATRAGKAFDYLFFWGHNEGFGKQIGKGCLSQWYEATFEVDGVRYQSTEQFMMAAKARLFGDAAILARILAEPDAAGTRMLGRRVKPFDESVWQMHRSALVTAGNFAKFSQNPRLGAYLLGTGDAILAEASPMEWIWGIGLTEEDPRARQPERWKGLNLLGFALMAARMQLAAQRQAHAPAFNISVSP